MENPLTRLLPPFTDAASLCMIRWLLGGALGCTLALPAHAGPIPAALEDRQFGSVDQGIPANCPEGIVGARPNRTVLQVIDGVLHRWAEHDLDQGLRLCLVLALPEARALSAAEASELLERSRAWELNLPDSEGWERLSSDSWELDALAPDMSFQIPSAAGSDRVGGSGSVGAELPNAATPDSGVIGDDNRVRRSLNESQNQPWNTIGYFLHEGAQGGLFRCTAFLVSPHLALTNAHCVRKSFTGLIRAGRFSPGQFSAGAGEDIIRPYGSRPIYEFHAAPGYASNPHPRHDYAGLHLTRPFTQITTFMPLVFEDPGSPILNNSGYPYEVHLGTPAEESPTYAQWGHFSSLSYVSGPDNSLMYHDADVSPGQSGSPLWRLVSGQRRVIAILCCGDPEVQLNLGPRLSNQNLDLIQSWLSWQPPTNPSNADEFGAVALPNRGRGFMLATNRGATRQILEPNHCGNISARRSAWWHWVPPVTRPITFTATTSVGGSMDLVVAVYRGARIDELTERACSTETGGSNTVTVAVPPLGTAFQHHIAVSARNGAEGGFSLSWAVQGANNDHFANSQTLTGTDWTAIGDNWGATNQIGEPQHCGNASSTTVWWRFPAQQLRGRLRVDTEGSDFDILIAAYTGSSLHNLSQRACNAAAGSNIAIEFDTQPGVSYYLATAGRSNAQGRVQLNYLWQPQVELFRDRFEPDS